MDLMTQAKVDGLLKDPAQIQQRDAEIKKVFIRASLTPEEELLIMDKINNHLRLEQALAKLKPFVDNS